jgi:leucyl/phenylalanyl-tRNA--protein transferase
LIPWLTANAPFPSVERALRVPNGLLAASDDLSASRLLEAYRLGIFPWFNSGEPVLWWSPDPRMVLVPGEFKISRSLARVLRNHAYEVRCDTAFEQVMRGCAAPRSKHCGTWIHEDIIAAYCELHRMGYAHSVETWVDGKLAGGLYGICIGRMFYGESMFSHASNASKIALAHLARQLERWQFGMVDCQMNTPHLASLGAREIPRNEFIARLQELVNCAPITRWQFDTDLFV